MIPKGSPGPVARVAAALLVVAAVGFFVFSLARYLGSDHLPRPDSDLDLPALVPRDLGRPEAGGGDASPGIPVLCYHYFRPGLTVGRIARVFGAVLFNLPTVPDRDYWTISEPAFEAHMAFLAENGYRTIGLEELTDYVEGKAPVPPRSVVITIDDGDLSFVRHAVPILRRYGFRATLFLLTGMVGESGWNGLDFVDWDTLRGLEREGVLRVESHTHDMHTKLRVKGGHVPRFLADCRDPDGHVSADSPLGADLALSRETIARELGHESRFLAWPFGFAESSVDSVADAVGFRRTVTLWPMRNGPGNAGPARSGPPVGIGRYTITARTSLRAFREMVAHPVLAAAAGGGDAAPAHP